MYASSSRPLYSLASPRSRFLAVASGVFSFQLVVISGSRIASFDVHTAIKAVVGD